MKHIFILTQLFIYVLFNPIAVQLCTKMVKQYIAQCKYFFNQHMDVFLSINVAFLTWHFNFVFESICGDFTGFRIRPLRR